MWQLWTVLLAKVCQKNSLSHSFAKTIGSNTWPWNHPQKHSCHGLAAAVTTMFSLLSFWYLHALRTRAQKKAAIYMKYPATLAHTCSWANNPKQVPLVYKEFGIHLPSSSFCLGGTRYAQIWCRIFVHMNPICLWAARNGKTSPSRPSTEALMPLHHFGETIWHYGLCRVCAKHLAEWTIWTIRLSIFCIWFLAMFLCKSISNEWR